MSPLESLNILKEKLKRLLFESKSTILPPKTVEDEINLIQSLVYLQENSGGGGGSWGSISGTLSSQTDLQIELDSKLESGDIANFETTTQLNSRDTNNRNRANHTGTQTKSTISDFAHTHTASEITDFDTEVANNTTVIANSTKLIPLENLTRNYYVILNLSETPTLVATLYNVGFAEAPTIARTEVGVFTLTSTGNFGSTKTAVFTQTNILGTVVVQEISTNVITLNCFDQDNTATDSHNRLILNIKVFV